MTTRPMPARCEVCKTFPPGFGVGFPANPGAVPGLPDHLRGACIYVCFDRECDLAAQKRALASARTHGLTLSKLWRHWPLTGAAQSQAERTTG